MTSYASLLRDDTFIIFLFHGVIGSRPTGIRNYTGKHLPLDRFVALLRELRAFGGTAVSMPDIVTATESRGSLPPRAFAVTFDDGFANNCTIAAPALAELGVPGAFYVTTGFVEANRPSWTDIIECAVDRAPKVALHLPFALSAQVATTLEEKRAVVDAIRVGVKGDPRLDPYVVADEVGRQLGIEQFEPDPELDQKMTWSQVRHLAADGLFTVGGHSHTHRILSYLDPDELEKEIATSVAHLRVHLGSAAEHYSYPEGLAHCYSNRVIDVLRGHGIRCAPSAIPGENRVGDDLFHLRRVPVV